MTLDLIVLAIVLYAATMGAIVGAIRQVAQWGALGVAFLCARPLGNVLGPKLGAHLHLAHVLGVVVATVAVFVGVFLAVRFALTQLLRSFLVGQHAERIRFDRALGFLLGAAKAFAIAFLILSAFAFVDDHVLLAGRRIGINARHSYVYQLARRHNLFEITQFGPVRDLARVEHAIQNPSQLERLRRDPAYRSLLADPRFRQVLSEPGLRRAFAQNDYRALLHNDTVLQLVQDRSAAARLNAAADAAQRD